MPRPPLVARYFVYLLRCSDGALYCGYTVDLAKRLADHMSGRGSKYTRSRLPVSLAYVEELPSLGAALRRELEIKRLSRRAKLGLCGARHRG
jgi:putative endonuclease